MSQAAPSPLFSDQKKAMPAKVEKSSTYIDADDVEDEYAASKQEASMLKQIYNLEMNDPERRSANLKVLSAIGLFAGGIAFLRLAGDLITPTF